ncbi:hypothetical protein Q0590_23545 [Rhodocytophaga aerolata]|uniref:Uncharacterized protein n=1 Tax=Rhodocytophaga aerolata TaxID=455078 RepID=A0ABT8RB16_9BACT|nr:hypothetical protein [Rhodocytophaga aerolata]MDO1449272.1 hypothetical protein [Rhodocytophaga aerolata]
MNKFHVTKPKTAKDEMVLVSAFRSMFLAVLMLCLLLSCPLKQELKRAFSKSAPVENGTASQKKAKSLVYDFDQKATTVACSMAVYSILADTELNPLLKNFAVKNPFFLLAASLASVYLLLITERGRKVIPPAFSGNFLAGNTALFLRLRKLLI